MAVLHPPEKLRSDVDYAYNKLQKLHPRLYEYISKEDLDFKFDSLKSTLNVPMTSNDFYFRLGPVIAAVRQGHTRLVPLTRKLTMGQMINMGITGNSPLDQFEFEIYEDKMFIVRNMSKDNTILPGTELVRVNHIRPMELVSKYSRTLSADGFNRTYKPRKSGEWFPNYFYFHNDLTDSVICELKYNDSIRTVTLKRKNRQISAENLKTREQRKAEEPQRKKESKKRNLQGYSVLAKTYSKNLEFAGPDSSIAILKVRDFSNGNYDQFYRNSFKLLDSLKTEYLVLDLRDNPGGEIKDARELFSYLADTAFQFIDKAEVVSRTSIVHSNYFRGNPLLLNVIIALGYPGELLSKGLLLLLVNREDDDKYYLSFPETLKGVPDSKKFKGELYVLVNGGTFSAASTLASDIRGSKKATFIGEETGGASNGSVAGRMAVYSLPESKLDIYIGLAHIQPHYRTGTEGRGIFPDIEIKPTLTDRIAGTDPELNRALEDIKSKKSRYAGRTIAHERSAFAVIDPTYHAVEPAPAPSLSPAEATWIYGRSELECYRLQLLRQRKDSAKLLVGYPGVYHLPYHSASFRLKTEEPVGPDTIRFRAVGEGKLLINNVLFSDFKASDSWHAVALDAAPEIREIRFDLSTASEPPALLIEGKAFPTTGRSWEWSADTEDWQPAWHFPQNRLGVPPHRLEDPTVILRPERLDSGLYDFGREMEGYVMVKTGKEPKISVGESKAEARDTANLVLEQSLKMVPSADGYWVSDVPLAFRYVHIQPDQTDTVQCRAIFHPLSYRGAFACSDSTLTRIWMSSAYTLRLCMQDFILDGVKRDRLPWAGDLAMSMIADAYTFDDPEVVRRSLVALGRAGIGEKDINGIVDYSLWWIIAQDHYQLYYGDTLHLKSEWERMKETLRLLSGRCDPSGFLIPEKSWLFIDWVDQKKWTALQVLWWWAQESGARLAHRTGDISTETRLRESAGTLKTRLTQVAWNEKNQFWLPDSTASGDPTRHPNFLAVISGLAPAEQYPGILKTLENERVSPVGTPYMAGFENMALARMGNMNLMLDRVRTYWGGMLGQGATTFWEAYDATQKGVEQYGFYDRPYAKSLCHAWSSGPAAFLPSEIFGLRPLEDGWKRFSMNPDMGDLTWACGTIPTKFGDILINIEKDNISITVPAGIILEWKGKLVEGPIQFTTPRLEGRGY
jgi:C-terminal processing protease CtpA/Prc